MLYTSFVVFYSQLSTLAFSAMSFLLIYSYTPCIKFRDRLLNVLPCCLSWSIVFTWPIMHAGGPTFDLWGMGFGWGSANTAVHILAPIWWGRDLKLCKVCLLLMHGDHWGTEEAGGDDHLCYLWGWGWRNPGANSSCMELLLQEEVRLSLGLSGGVG